MKKLTFILFLFLSGCSPRSVSMLTIQPNRVLYISTDINKVSSGDSIAKIRPGIPWLGKNIKLTLRNGERTTVPKKEIWGYSDEKGKVWRSFQKSFYQVMQVSDVVEYEIIESRPIGNGGVVNEPVRKYSKTLDSRIVGSRKRALRDSK